MKLLVKEVALDLFKDVSLVGMKKVYEAREADVEADQPENEEDDDPQVAGRCSHERQYC